MSAAPSNSGARGCGMVLLGDSGGLVAKESAGHARPGFEGGLEAAEARPGAGQVQARDVTFAFGVTEQPSFGGVLVVSVDRASWVTQIAGQCQRGGDVDLLDGVADAGGDRLHEVQQGFG